MKICIKVACKSPLLHRLYMLKACGTFAKDSCEEHTVLLLQAQICILKTFRLLYTRVSYFSAWISRGADLGNFPYLGHIRASDYALSHQTGHKSSRKLCRAPWEQGRLIVYLLYISPLCAWEV